MPKPLSLLSLPSLLLVLLMSLALLESTVCVCVSVCGDCSTFEFMQHTLHDFQKIAYSLEMQKTLLLQTGTVTHVPAS